VAVVYRWAENQLDRLPELATELVRQQVTVIAPPTTSCALAVKALTTTIPIVFLTPEDPVRFGLVASLARPGGNLTGVNLFTGELSAKRLEILRDMVPGATHVAVLVNPTNPATETTVRHNKWLVVAIVPGVERQPLKKLNVDEEALLKLLHRWGNEAGQAGARSSASSSLMRPDATASGWHVGCGDAMSRLMSSIPRASRCRANTGARRLIASTRNC
jgi:hypothetical protein